MDEIKINCPFCGTPIKAMHKPSLIRELKKTTWGGNKPAITRDAEILIIMEDCPKCGKSKKEIQKRLKEGKEVPREEVLKRLIEAGLDPTKLK
jgi:endogenous inhibitor of DNA gyrase (YacG/DUF329 family)